MHHNPAARMVRQRRQSAPSATVIVDSAPPTATSAVDIAALGVPTSTKALAVIVSLLAAIILLGVGYFFWRRKRNAKEEKTQQSHIIDFTSEKALTFDVDRKLDLHASAYGIEKPSPAFIPVVVASTPDADMSTGWVPQIIPNRSTDLASQSSLSSNKSKGSKKSFGTSRGWDKTLSKYAPSERSPPPSYMADSKTATLASQVPLPPSPPHKPTLPPTPPTPPAFKKTSKLNPFSRDIPSAKPMPTELPPSLPLPSPARSASFAAHQDGILAQLEGPEEDMPAPARLMVVSSPFTPSLDDELPITVGETLRVLEEFQDGWALCQRIGRIDAPKGVVPRTCLTEREKIIPAGRRL
ncbi:hypothetical protein FB45DRAFT_914317 [Roridomyces roridus]|uniref:SH3 domain-containing protein n=1 Tax=Roridomyces roridus TaxID=1738132 RepID=A0AAD7BXH3_9AGAR|nr:hypothetical protein FB45DRAFT_914317 [Roridomyces roridus]